MNNTDKKINYGLAANLVSRTLPSNFAEDNDPGAFFDIVDEFYKELQQRHIKHGMTETSNEPTAGMEELATKIKCDKCNGPMVYRTFEKNGVKGGGFGCKSWKRDSEENCKSWKTIQEAEQEAGDNQDDNSKLPF